MFTLSSIDKFEINGRGTLFVVESPVSADRNFKSMRSALGYVVEIDSNQYEPIGFEMNMPATTVRIGERIGIMVRRVACREPD